MSNPGIDRGRGAVCALIPKRTCLPILGLALFALLACTGCGSRSNDQLQTTETSSAVSPPPTATVPSDDLREAEEVVRAYWQAVIQGDYAKAASKTEAVLTPEAQRKGFEQRLESAYAPMALTAIASIGPARQDIESPRKIIVSYSIEGKSSCTGNAILRREDSTHGLLITGGI